MSSSAATKTTAPAAPAKPASDPAADFKAGMRNIAITAVVLGVVYFFYSSYVHTTAQLKKLQEQISTLTKYDNPADYRSAAKFLDDGLALRNDPWFVGNRADVAALLSINGESANQAIAENFVKQAVDLKLNTEARFDAEGLTLIAANKLDEAEKSLNFVVERGAARAPIIADLGMIHQRQGKVETAKNDFKQSADRDWINPRFGALYGDALYDNAEYGNADGAYSRALEGYGSHIRSLIGKARAQIAQNTHLTESLKTLNEILASADTLSPLLKERALVGRAEGYLATGDPAKAETGALEGINAKVEGDTGAAYAQFTLGLALAAQKKKNAFDAFKLAIDTVKYIPHFYFDGALALARADMASDGAQLLNKYGAMITKPDGKMKVDDAYHRAKGEFLTIAGQYDDALAEYDLAIADNNINPDTFYRKGLVFEKQGDAMRSVKKFDKKKATATYNAALEQFEKGIALRERSPDAYREEGLIFLDANPKDPKVMEKFGKALAYYKAAKAPKAVTDAFVSQVEAKYLKAGPKFKKVAEEWRKEATDMLKP